ncbi:hypothetical protein KKF64_01210 [Patescibacteria group bacterium]|nr:hypothetical protein [Patescibacteria group bacterium]
MEKIKFLIILLSAALIGAACAPTVISNDSDGGIWVSENNGEIWEQRINIYYDRAGAKTIGNLDIKEIIFSSQDNRKIFIISEKNGLWVTWNSGYNWDLIFRNTSINDMAIDRENPRRLYLAFGHNIAVSNDEGVHWKSTYISDDTTAFITSLVLDPDNSNVLYAATNKQNILISENSGISWRVHTELPRGIILENMQFHSNELDLDSKQRSIYAIAQTKGLFKSKDAGKTWELFDIAGEPRDYKLIPSGVVYASSSGLFRSLNFGKDWTSLPLISGKNDANIYALAINPEDPLEIFYGSRSTLYHSVDGGFNWIPRSLPSARSSSEIIIHPDDPDTLYMGVSRLR